MLSASVRETTLLSIKNAPLVGLAEDNTQFSNYQLAALVLIVPYIVKLLLPLVSHGGFKTYPFHARFDRCTYHRRLLDPYVHLRSAQERQGHPTGKDIKEKLYNGKNKIPMQVFHDACFEGKIDFNGDVMAQRHDWAKFTFTPELFRYVFMDFLPELIVPSKLKSQDEEQDRDHYDRGDDFYGWCVFLSPRMVYTSGVTVSLPSCAINWTSSLRTGQHTTILFRSRLTSVSSLLYIGCGWGMLVAYAAKNFGCDATGVTLGKNQAKFGTENIAQTRNGVPADKAYILCRDYRETPHGQGIYDQIVSLVIAELLADDGDFVFQVAGLRQGLLTIMKGTKYVFSGADTSVSPAWVINKLEQANFEVKSTDVSGVYYSATTWRCKDEIVSKYDSIPGPPSWPSTQSVRELVHFSFFPLTRFSSFRAVKASVFEITLQKDFKAYHWKLGASNHVELADPQSVVHHSYSRES
ncbi:cyclopropane fatty acid synthase domain-containing protein [Mycena galericulata]|nr:cyclopropane fatty acid synthase domain-containing protein [Mycena galericulata]